MTASSDEEARGHLVALEELVHRFGTCTEAREEHLVNRLDTEVAQRAIVTMQSCEVRS